MYILHIFLLLLCDHCHTIFVIVNFFFFCVSSDDSEGSKPSTPHISKLHIHNIISPNPNSPNELAQASVNKSNTLSFAHKSSKVYNPEV
uniref:Uncharacterized protein n=1 Tax=Arundo donax TaxID=35708 RepID=A0A0A9GRY1_ARUDO